MSARRQPPAFDQFPDNFSLICTLAVARGQTGYFFVTAKECRGLVAAGATLSEALADVPQAFADFLAVGADVPSVAGVELPPIVPIEDPPV